jgi:L-amino acid N-acyltransferase YncA
MIKDRINDLIRFVNSLRRPSKATNMRKLKERDEVLSDFVIRDAVEQDIPRLGALHAETWAETYSAGKNPAYQIREHQWREQFTIKDGSWFCFVVENKKGELVGFAKGKKYAAPELPGYSGELNKIYLLQLYQRMGLGRQLFFRVVKRFLSKGISSMVLFGVPQNPSCAFHEAMGGKKLLSNKGEFHGGYGWKSLEEIVGIKKTGCEVQNKQIVDNNK